ncbi:hypothetical protein OESDEN_15659, partial [Oesophagostomum dentatum]
MSFLPLSLLCLPVLVAGVFPWYTTPFPQWEGFTLYRGHHWEDTSPWSALAAAEAERPVMETTMEGPYWGPFSTYAPPRRQSSENSGASNSGPRLDLVKGNGEQHRAINSLLLTGYFDYYNLGDRDYDIAFLE